MNGSAASSDDLASRVQAVAGPPVASPGSVAPPTTGSDLGTRLQTIAAGNSNEEQTDSGFEMHHDGSFTITPKEGESFEDTMQRAATYGKKVSPALLQQQTIKGLKETPIVLGASALMGFGGGAALAGMGEAGGAAAAAAGATANSRIIGPAIKAVKAIVPWARAHPWQAWMLYQALDEAGVTKPIKNLPGGGVIPFLLMMHGQGGAGAATEAETVAEAEATAPSENLASTEQSAAATAKEAMETKSGVQTSATTGSESPVDEETEPGDHRTREQKQAAVDDYYAKHPEKRPQQKIIQRGPRKGTVKMRRVFANGQWNEVPVYK